MAKKILVVDDDRELLKLLRLMLTKNGYSVKDLPDGHDLLKKVRAFKPDLIVLDLMLPEINGLDLCKQLKADKRLGTIPVIMLTAKSTEMDKVVGLEMGAEDYVTKPFGVNELLARVRAMLRRPSAKEKESREVLELGKLRLEDAKREVSLGGKELKLTPIEYALLKTLLEEPGRVLARDELLEGVWGYDKMANTRTVDVHVRRLRQKLGGEAKRLKTVSGVGYKLAE